MTPIDPVRKSVWVPLAPDRAFALFSEGLDTWWPVDTHSISARQDNTPHALTVDASEGGKIEETLPDGSKCVWGHFTRYEPSNLVEIAWYVGRDPSEATRIIVAFAAEKDGTRVDLVHDGWDALGSDAETVADNYQVGWDLVLGSYTSVA